jgi:hypothetical protein
MLNHYLPASYLSLFSVDKNKPRRQRTVYIGDFKKRNCYQSVAQKCAGENNFYDEIIEKFWHIYEPKLPESIEKLINMDIDIFLWGSILVPFVSSLFVRTPTFNSLMENRLETIGFSKDRIPLENINYDRIFEFQRLLAPVLSADWIVLKINGNTPLITNDIGYAPFSNPGVGDHGWAIPLGLSHILALVPKQQRIIATFINNKWIPNIHYLNLPKDNHNSFNSILSQYSRRFIFGSDSSIICRYLNGNNNQKIPEFAQAGFITGIKAMQYELTWFKFLNIVSIGIEEILELGLSNIPIMEPFYKRLNTPETNPPPFLDPFKVIDNSLQISII